MNVLVTGGLGYIGSHIVVDLLNSQFKVAVVDNLSNSNINVKNKIEFLTKRK
ncbi:NAD-dependent epimerase/dehydratase family protein, partial [Escherichia coli]|nr:NAD-dependent epimerase/dehydratase family protein [Escherichia coli]